MSEHCHDENDLKLLKEMKQLASHEFTAWLNLNDIVGRDGAIPRKYRELIAIAVVCTTQRSYCIEAHSKAAGATRAEVFEAAFVAAALARRGRGDPLCDGAQVFRQRTIAKPVRASLRGRPSSATTQPRN